MLCKSLSACVPIIANDGCRVFELLHPVREGLDLPYSLAIAEVEPDQHSYRHQLRQVEVYFVLSGRGRMHVDEEARDLAAGDVVLVPAGATQWIENSGRDVLRFAALVSPPWRSEDDVRLP